MKYWLSHLPLEVWVDCYRYPWISRKELGKIVDRFKNRKYAEYLQFFLHDWGKRSLKPIHFRQQKKDERAAILERLSMILQAPMPNTKSFEPLPNTHIPQTPLPKNIKSFEYIQIGHFDQQTIDFLRRIQPVLQSSTDIKLRFYSDLAILRTILPYLLPLLGRIRSLLCNVRALHTVGQCFGNEKLAKLRVLEIVYEGNAGMDEQMKQTAVNFLMDWLTGQDNNPIGEPKSCAVQQYKENGISEQISTAIRQQFLAAKSPRTFAILVRSFEARWDFAEFHLQNSIGEELHGVAHFGRGYIQITRHKANCGKELQEWIDENEAARYSLPFQNQIDLQSPTLGSIDAMDAPEKNEDSDPQQPSTSKGA